MFTVFGSSMDCRITTFADFSEVSGVNKMPLQKGVFGWVCKWDWALFFFLSSLFFEHITDFLVIFFAPLFLPQYYPYSCYLCYWSTNSSIALLFIYFLLLFSLCIINMLTEEKAGTSMKKKNSPIFLPLDWHFNDCVCVLQAMADIRKGKTLSS